MNRLLPEDDSLVFPYGGRNNLLPGSFQYKLVFNEIELEKCLVKKSRLALFFLELVLNA